MVEVTLQIVSLALLVGLLAAAPAVGQTADASGPITEVSGPTIIGFAAAEVAADADSLEYASEAIAHLQFALANVGECLAELEPTIDQQFSDIVTWEIDGKKASLQLSDDPYEQVGAVLIRPGSDPEIVYASVGPSSLLYFLPNAAAEYFGVPGCKVEL